MATLGAQVSRDGGRRLHLACREAEGGHSFMLLIPERKRRRMKMLLHNWTFMVVGGGRNEDVFTYENQQFRKKDKKILILRKKDG